MAVFARSIGYPTGGCRRAIPLAVDSQCDDRVLKNRKTSAVFGGCVCMLTAQRRRGMRDSERLLPAIHPCHPHPSCFHRREPGSTPGQLVSRMSFLFRSVRIETVPTRI
jgi:hypothetical protein